MSILANSKDAFAAKEVKDPEITIEITNGNGRSLVTITDNAGGIPEAIIDRIFDPYFTTNKGTGIGLFMSKIIIEQQMSGSLTARNVGKGARFRILV